MNDVVIDASAGAEIVAGTRRGRALARLIPPESEGWVPEHFYAEVLGVIRRRVVVTSTLTEVQGLAAVERLAGWRLHRASSASLVSEAWEYRHNMTAADAMYVVLARHLEAQFLSDDYNLVDGPTFPRELRVLSLPTPS